MKTKTKSKSKPRPMFHVGDRVSFDLVKRKVNAVVTEDRGAIGVGGRRLYQVQVQYSVGEPMIFEMPEVDLRAEPNGSASK